MHFDVFLCSIGMPGSVHGGLGGGCGSHERGSGQRVDESGSRLGEYFYFTSVLYTIFET
jgi:hypothetical protein